MPIRDKCENNAPQKFGSIIMVQYIFIYVCALKVHRCLEIN